MDRASSLNSLEREWVTMNSSKQAKTMRRVLLQVVLPTAFTLYLLISCYSSFLQCMDLSYNNQFISRKVMFLFCNAILLFIVRDSGLLAPSASGIHDELVPVKRSDVRPPQTDDIVCRNLVQSTSQSIFVSSPISLPTGPIRAICRNIVVEENSKVQVMVGRPSELIVEEEEEEEELKGVVGVDQGVSEEELLDLGVEELNKRCEEFIEKVKRERQIEAKQLVIMV